MKKYGVVDICPQCETPLQLIANTDGTETRKCGHCSFEQKLPIDGKFPSAILDSPSKPPKKASTG